MLTLPDEPRLGFTFKDWRVPLPSSLVAEPHDELFSAIFCLPISPLLFRVWIHRLEIGHEIRVEGH
jgi:hypothetical protein